MTEAVYEPLSVSVLTPLLPAVPGGLVMFDIDLTLANGCYADMAEFEARPGAVAAVHALIAAGFRVGVWTAGGPVHAVTVTDRMGLAEALVHRLGKPDVLDRKSVTALLGEMPVLTVDDDWGEAVDGVPFHRVQAFWGTRVSAAVVVAYEAAQAVRPNA